MSEKRKIYSASLTPDKQWINVLVSTFVFSGHFEDTYPISVTESDCYDWSEAVICPDLLDYLVSIDSKVFGG